MASYSPEGRKELDTTERLHLGYCKSSTHVFNTLNLNFKPHTYYGLPYSYLPKEMWSAQGRFGLQIQFQNLHNFDIRKILLVATRMDFWISFVQC